VRAPTAPTRTLRVEVTPLRDGDDDEPYAHLVVVRDDDPAPHRSALRAGP